MNPARSGRRTRPAVGGVLSAATLTLSLAGAGALAAVPASAAGPSGSTAATAAPTRALSQRAIIRNAMRHARAGGAGASAPAVPVHRTAGQGTTDPGTNDQGTGGTSGPSPFIVGGSQTTISSAPWMVQLFYWDPATDDSRFCGGTLVAPNKVLTAAHCVAGANWVANGVVIAGATDLPDDQGYTTGVVRDVKRQWTAAFSSSTLDNDIAVLTLAHSLSLSSTIRTAPLAASDDSALYTPGTAATVYGWGLTTSAPDAPLSQSLKTATLPIQADSTCDASLLTALGADYFRAGHMICAGYPATGDDTTATTTCAGDSGGPLMVNGRIAGIVSWGVSSSDENGNVVQWCDVKDTYDVFTKVSTYTAAAQERINDFDWSGNGRADLLVRTSTGSGYVYLGSSLRTRTYVLGGWQYFNKAVQTDLNRNGAPEVLARSTAGNLWLRHWISGKWSSTKLYTGWGTVRQILVPGDLDGDTLPDMLMVDSSGRLWLYPGKGTGYFGTRRLVGSYGWQSFANVVGHGDLTGDGKPDIVARTPGGVIYLYPGKGNGYFGARRTLSTAFKYYNGMAAVGDITGDGHADLVMRSNSGYLYVYPGKGNGYFGGRITIGYGWNQFTWLG